MDIGTNKLHSRFSVIVKRDIINKYNNETFIYKWLYVFCFLTDKPMDKVSDIRYSHKYGKKKKKNLNRSWENH